MEEENKDKLHTVKEEIDHSHKKTVNVKQEELDKGNETPFQEEETDIVLYPVAPKARVPTDEQVDVKISPAFQILDQVSVAKS